MMLADMLLYNDSKHEYLVMNGPGKAIHIPGVSELISYAGVIPPTDFKLHPKYRARGTFVHSITERIDDGDWEVEEETPAEWLPFVKAYKLFLNDHAVEIVESEILVANDSLFYAGRLDRILMVDGKRFLCDYKTGYRYRWHIVQLASYQLCTKEDNLASLFLRDDGTYLWHEWKDEEAAEGREVVNSMARCYWFAHPRDHKLLRQL
ncbi:hypothetical protein SDC9_115056 [bioreactor metagenome]|uniref:PD-(D/E)XK endonuclease-like domain-containing protein n=1 Tax=bioreactor metagenome TaxID=1076179 RepID=A0A645BS22_9ZZZZ